MVKVELKLPHHRYDIQIGAGLLARLGEIVRDVAPHTHAALLADAIVFDEHGMAARSALASAGYHVIAHAVPPGEDHKNLETVRKLYGVLVGAHMERKSPLIALGGGVIGDTAGFVASTYLRGVPFIQSPTTLLAMVDASVGGKVGVNLPQGKNLVGSFYQPRAVVIDTDTLSTLPARELRCGLAECVKHAVIRDATLFDWIESYLDEVLELDPPTLVELVRRNVQIKAGVVMADEKETGERAHLNFGHTFAHAIEATAGYGTYHHGEAVSLGMIAAARLAAQQRRCDPALVERLVRLLTRIGLPTTAPDLADNDALMHAMGLDKKVAGGKLRLVLPERMGSVTIVADVPAEAVRAAWDTLREAA